MKSTVLIGIIILVLMLDWAALDDITTGSQPSFLGEYIMLAVSIPILTVSGYLLNKMKKQKKE